MDSSTRQLLNAHLDAIAGDVAAARAALGGARDRDLIDALDNLATHARMTRVVVGIAAAEPLRAPLHAQPGEPQP